MATENNRAIEISNLKKSYGAIKAVDGISFYVKKGQVFTLLGPNGAGKSTLLKAIVGLISLESGILKIYGQPLKKVRKKLAYLPQNNDLDYDFPVSVLDVVLMGRYPHLGLIKRPKEKDYQIAKKALKDVGLLDLANRQIAKLSGVQRQRVFLARALAQKAEIMLFDEPFSGVDKVAENKIYQLLDYCADLDKTIVVVNHDLKKAREYFEQLILINKKIIAVGPAHQVFTPDNLNQTFNQQAVILDGKLVVLK